MKVNQLNLIYFSPTGTTRKVTMAAAGKMELKSMTYDLTTNYRTKEPVLKFTEQDFVLIGIPVYSGRVPKLVLKYLESLKASNTPAALIATYGNRDYDDALLELKSTVEKKGLKVIAAAAFPVRHSIVRAIAKNRPDKDDLKKIQDFGLEITRGLKSIEDLSSVSLNVKGNEDYPPYKKLPLVPHGKSTCTDCKLCAKHCPASAIPLDKPRKTNRKECISCMRCVYNCPVGARRVNPLFYKKAANMLFKYCSERKEPEIFLPK